MSWSNSQQSNPFNDPAVDLISQITGTIDTLPSLSFDMPDEVIVKNLNARIEDSTSYWNNSKGFNLEESRNQSVRAYLGKQNDKTQYYRYQNPRYNENQIYVAEESIVAYLTAQNPQPEVYPSQDTPQAKIFAGDLEKAMMAHSEHFGLAGLAESCVRNTLNKKVGFIYFHFDPDYGKNGEIIPMVVDPSHVVVDKNAKKGQDPDFICINLKMNAAQIIHRWPSKKKKVFEELGWSNMSQNRMVQDIVIREVWVTNYDKKFMPSQGCVYYFGNIVLDKYKDPNWIHTNPEKNFLPAPMKPFIPLNFDNDGSHWIDQTSPIEQAMSMQDILNNRGQQMKELADKANGILVVSSDSGLTKDDLQNLTGDPNQRLLIKTAGQKTADMVFQVPPPIIIPFLMQDKLDIRTQIHAIMGTPSEFTGSDDGGGGDDQTLGQAVMKKNQAAGRQDLFARAIDRFMRQYFNFLVQMMAVWYDEKHFFVYNGGDGEFDYVTISRDLIDKGIAVTVKSGTTLPFDKGRQEAVALQMAKMGLLSPLDVYKMLHMPNPQQLYDNYAKFKTQPQDLARDAMEESDSNDAYVAFVDIMAGKPAPSPDDCTKEFVLSLRKLMLRDEFLKADRKKQKAFLDFVEKAISSLELRTSLDQMSQGGIAELKPEVPIQPPQPEQPQMQPMMPGAAPGQMPGLPPQPGMMPPGAAPGMMPPPQGLPQGLPPMGMPPQMPPQLGAIPQPQVPPVQPPSAIPQL